MSDPPTHAEEYEVLNWARGRRGDDLVGPIWARLCVLLGCPDDAHSGELLDQIGLCGGNTLVNLARRGGVAYPEVAHDVARQLRRFWERDELSRQDVAGCERFVLRKMQVGDDDLAAMCQAARDRAEGRALVICAKSAAVEMATDKALAVAGASLERLAARAAARKAAARVTRETSQRAAQTAANTAARRSAGKAAELATKHAMRQVLARVLVPLNVIWVAWAVVDIAGPAYRKTIPAVTYLALLRRLYLAVTGGPATS